ncbi:MAG: restriction endonuclease [Methanoregulaceae archaeon]|nr:restriction endonuclease [Methanoregulaceae archaeon]
MAVWLVRAGKSGEHENLALEKGVVVAGWSDLGDLSGIGSKTALLTRLQEVWPDLKPKTLINWNSQVWPFVNDIKPGDIVALPLKSRPFVAFGRVTGKYKFAADAPNDAQNQLPVEWIKEVPRSSIPQDILYSLGAFMTVCRIWRNDAEVRIHALLDGKDATLVSPVVGQDDPDADGVDVDLETVVREQIRGLIYARFKGHGLSRLVAAVLEAQGYRTVTSPAGPDGGVDVVAGSGPLGFDPPRLVVQVKSEQSPIDVKVVRELQGVMKSFGADHGMVIAWGGFKGTVIKETSRQFFEIRLWSSDDLVTAVLDHYDRLSDEIRAELPLKRIWTVVLEGD